MKYNFEKNKKVDSPIKGKVCKHVINVISSKDSLQDCTFIKLTNVHENGERSIDFLKVLNYKRPFYIVKEKYRKFKEKKDYIDKRLVKEYSASESRLPMVISRILYGRNDKEARLKQLKNNENLFGCETTSAVVIKRKFQDKYRELSESEPATFAAYDVETEVDRENPYYGHVIMASTTYKDLCYFCALRSWYDGLSDEEIERTILEKAQELAGERLKKRNIKIYIELVDNEGEIVYNNVMMWHQTKPDFIISWNSAYDMKCNEVALLENGYDPKEVYSHPGTPREYMHYNFNQGSEIKPKQNGDSRPLEWHERFPTLVGASTWQWLDYGSFYSIKNTAGGKKESYSLQFTCTENGVDGKLYTDVGSHLEPGSEPWHYFMQKSGKFEYSIYNIIDNVAMEELAEKTNDIALNLPLLLKSSELHQYVSQPTLISNELSFIAEQNGFIWGTKGTKGPLFDDEKPTLGQWIALLETEKNSNLGVPLFDGMPSIRSRGRGLTADIDVTGAYPTATVALNVSNKTTRMEACRIEGLNALQFREVGVNYASSPKSNAISLCHMLHGFPTLEEIERKYEGYIAKEAESANTPLKDNMVA